MSTRVARTWSIDDLRRLAKRRLPRAVFDFIDGGAETESTLRANRAAFERVRFLPKVLIDVSKVDTSTTILGGPSKLPIAIAPDRRGRLRPARRRHRDRAAPRRRSGSPTRCRPRRRRRSSRSRARRPAGCGSRCTSSSAATSRSGLIERARAADYEAIVVTVDLAVGGKRERDMRNDFSVPFRFTRRNLLDFATRPAWAFDMLTRGMPVMENLVGFENEAASSAAIAASVGRNMDPSFDWDGLKAIRDKWPRKLIVKGVERADDAERLAAMGCDGVIVSNHGGRQLDGACATLDALPAVARAAGKRMSVFVDGGVRRGGDAVKAVALGAEAAMIGRATLFGACAGGEPGAVRALEILRDELVRTMQLCGVTRVGAIGPELLAPER